MKNQSAAHSYELPPTRSHYISSELCLFMETEKAFLHPGYSLRDLSMSLDIPMYQLSAFFNRVMGYNFNDYLNRLRVRYCVELLRSEDVHDLNMHGLAARCGFRNRNSFSSAFKKFTGHSPSCYIAKIYKGGHIGALNISFLN